MIFQSLGKWSGKNMGNQFRHWTRMIPEGSQQVRVECHRCARLFCIFIILDPRWSKGFHGFPFQLRERWGNLIGSSIAYWHMCLGQYSSDSRSSRLQRHVICNDRPLGTQFLPILLFYRHLCTIVIHIYVIIIIIYYYYCYYYYYYILSLYDNIYIYTYIHLSFVKAKISRFPLQNDDLWRASSVRWICSPRFKYHAPWSCADLSLLNLWCSHVTMWMQASCTWSKWFGSWGYPWLLAQVRTISITFVSDKYHQVPKSCRPKKNQDPSCSAEALRWRPHSGGFDPQLGRVSKGAGFGKKWKHMGKKNSGKNQMYNVKRLMFSCWWFRIIYIDLWYCTVFQYCEASIF